MPRQSNTYGDRARAGADPLTQRDWAPTARLRWVRRPMPWETPLDDHVLQQWYAPNVADYMRGGEGEWRDVLLEEEK